MTEQKTTLKDDPEFKRLVAEFRKEGYSKRVAEENAARVIAERRMD